jgi:CBS domain-containing protein
MKICDVLKAKGSTEVFTILATASLKDLIGHCCDHNVGALLATDDAGKLAGIVTERDVLHQCNKGTDFDSMTVADIMTTSLVSVQPDDDINIAMDLMVHRKIRHLPVIDDSGIHGLVTVRDLIYAMRKADQEELHAFIEYLKASTPKEST